MKFCFLFVKQLTSENIIATNGKKTCKIEEVTPREYGMKVVSLIAPTIVIFSTPYNNIDNTIQTKAAFPIF